MKTSFVKSSLIILVFSLVIVALIASVSDAAREPWSSPKKTDVRSPCPMLNAMANHGYIERDGTNIPLGNIIRVLESETIGFPSMVSFLYPMFVGRWMTFNKQSNVDLDGFDVFDHDASLTRKDFSLTGHRKVNKELVNQLLSFAGTKGYLTYDDLAKARALRYVQSKKENPNFKFSLVERFMAVFDAVNLMEIIGHDGKLPVDIARDFLLNERLPLKWTPHKWDIGFYGVYFYRQILTFTAQTYYAYFTMDNGSAPAAVKKDEL